MRMSGSDDEQHVGASSHDSITTASRHIYDMAPPPSPPQPPHRLTSMSLPSIMSKRMTDVPNVAPVMTSSSHFSIREEMPIKKPLKQLTMAAMLSPVSPVPDNRPRRSSGMLSMTELCNTDNAEEENDDVVYINTTSPRVYRDTSRGPHSVDMDESMSTADEGDGDSDFQASVATSFPMSSKKKAVKRAKRSMVQPPTFLKGGGSSGPHGEMDDEDGEEEMDEGWSDHNRWYCNICKDGGELLCCDRCPRAFHMRCLGMKDETIPDTEWYCKMCSECLDRRRIKRESREKARLMREAEKLERDAKKLQLQQIKEDALAQKSAQALEDKARRVLEMQDRILSRRKVKYKDKEEEKLGLLAQELAQAVRIAKEKLAKLEKEDASLRKKEEAFNKRNPGDLKLHLRVLEGQNEEEMVVKAPEKLEPSLCSFGDIPSELSGQVLAVWDGVMSVSEILQLAFIPLSAFAAALVHPQPTLLMTEVHMCMLDLILEDREEEDYVSDDEGASMDEKERFRYEVQRAPLTVGVPTSNMLNSMSWPSILYHLIVSVPRYMSYASSPSMQAALAALRNVSEYSLLDTCHKLQLLQFLIGRVYGTEKVRRWLSLHAGKAIEWTKEYNRNVLLDRKVAMEEEKKLRERQRAELLAIPESKDKHKKKSTKKKTKIASDGVEGVGEETLSDVELEDAEEEEEEAEDDEEEFTEEALIKQGEELEAQQESGSITRHEYVLEKKQIDQRRDTLRKRADDKNKKHKAQEHLERKRILAKKGIQEALGSKDVMVLRLAIEKGKEVDVGDRIIASASHVAEMIEAEIAREEEMERKKRKYIKTLREYYIRTEALGRDRHGYRYWLFRGDSSRLYVEKPIVNVMRDWYRQAFKDSEPPRSTWCAYSTQAEVKSLIEALDRGHPRENALRTALVDNFDLLEGGMPVSKPGLLISDLLNDKEEGGSRSRRGSSSSSSGIPSVQFDAWRNDKRTWRKKNHSVCDVDAFCQDLIGVEGWVSKRLKELGSNWHEQEHSNWIKSVKDVERWEDCISPLLVLENEVMTFQLRARTLLAGSSVTVISTAVEKSEPPSTVSVEEQERNVDEEEEEEDDEMEDITTDDGSFLWPTQKCRTRWINEVKKARSLATLAAALACFVQRLDILGLSDFALDDPSISTRRMKTEKEKRSQKEAAAAIKKKQKKEEVIEEEDENGRECRDPVDDWEEDCYICKEGGELLCCDGCRHVFHFPCVGLRRVPRGKTFCHHCDPSVQPVYSVGSGPSRRRTADEKKRPAVDSSEMTDEEVEEESFESKPKKRRMESTPSNIMEDAEAEVVLDTKSMNADVVPKPPEDQWDVECCVCQLGGELLCCDGCPRAFHTQCIGMVKIPEREWFCNECNQQTCGGCSKNKIRLDSHVICGSEDGTKGCDRVFHLKCAKLTAVPEDDWYCKKCQKMLK